jgi:SAM-dependent methyltransferase
LEVIDAHVMWHDVECGAYTADLELWQELARRGGGSVLDVGAGTGRVALPLAAAGHTVTALDRDALLLAALRERAQAAGVHVRTVVADAAEFDAGSEYALVAVPMQTIQLLPDERARAGFFACARRAVAPGGIVALAIAAGLEGFDGPAELPLPDVGEDGGRRFVSQPTAVRERYGSIRIERLRRTVGPGGEHSEQENVVVLAAVTAAHLHAEGAAAGLRPDSTLEIAPTLDHVGAEVVLLRG